MQRDVYTTWRTFFLPCWNGVFGSVALAESGHCWNSVLLVLCMKANFAKFCGVSVWCDCSDVDFSSVSKFSFRRLSCFSCFSFVSVTSHQCGLFWINTKVASLGWPKTEKRFPQVWYLRALVPVVICFPRWISVVSIQRNETVFGLCALWNLSLDLTKNHFYTTFFSCYESPLAVLNW